MTDSVKRSVLGQKFVRASGLLGKYLARGAVYFGENVVAFVGFIVTAASLLLAGDKIGLTIPGISTAFSAAVQSSALMTAVIGGIVATAASETTKKVYKDCVEWTVGAYKSIVRDIFEAKYSNITDAQLAAKQAKHPNNPKYASVAKYVEAKEKQYKAYDKKTLELDLAGNYGKRVFKAGANALLDAGSTVAAMPWQFAAYVNSFGSSVVKSDNDDNTVDNDFDNTTKPSNGTTPGMAHT